jgi:DNA-binding LacI/PurR family transcriptional regulator
MKTRLLDIANHLGVSVATVSRALHREDSTLVSEATRRQVQEAAERLGYHPNLLGRSLVKGMSACVAFWCSDSFLPYYTTLARYLSAEAQRQGYHLLLSTRELTVGASLQSTFPWNFDAVISCDMFYSDAIVAQLGVPIVALGAYRPDAQVDFVGIDLRTPLELALRRLIAAGERRIAFLTNMELETADPRMLAYRTTLAEASLPLELIALPSQQRQDARKTVAMSIAKSGCPDVILCHNDEVAVGCARGLYDLGLRLPEDVRLLGCDGLEETLYQACPLTTIETPHEALCQQAWQLLERRLSQPTAPVKSIIVSADLRWRESTRGNSKGEHTH